MTRHGRKSAKEASDMVNEVALKERGYSQGRTEGFGMGAEWCIKLISSVLLNYGISDEIVGRMEAILEKEKDYAVEVVGSMMEKA